MADEKKRPRRAKTTGGLYQRASDDMWCASVELPSADPTKRRRKVIVRAKKADALAELRKARQALEKSGDLPTSSPTVSQWCDLWWARYGMKRLKVSTRPTYQSKIEHYIRPAIGRVRLDKLAPDHVYRLHDFVIDTKGLEPASALAAHRVLSVMLTDAEREGRITRNVAKLADKPRVAKKRKEYLDNAEARQLLLSVKDDPYASARWGMAILSGKRQGECLGLTRDMLDFEAGTMTIAWQLQRLTFEHGCELVDDKPGCGRKRGGNCPKRHITIPADQEAIQIDGGLYMTRPKSSSSWQVLPMVGLLRKLLEQHVESNPPGVHGLVFTRDGGRPVDMSDDSAAWDAALRTAGLPDVDLHSARHTCNTVLTELGVSVDVRRQMLGHASNAINEAVYTHTSDLRVADAMRQLGEAMGVSDPASAGTSPATLQPIAE